MLTIENDKCTMCEECVNACLKDALKVDGDVIAFDSEKCIMCGHCMAVCPRDAVIIDGDGYDCTDVEDLSFAKKPNELLVRNMILARRSTRVFSDIEVTDDEINRILEAGKYAPTAVNLQGNEFLVVMDPENRAELTADAYEALKRIKESQNPMEKGMLEDRIRIFEEEDRDKIFYNAPVVLYIFTNNEIDAGIAATTMGFMAQAQQLGYCIAKLPALAFEDREFSAKWQAPAGKKCAIALLIGNAETQFFSSVPRKTPHTIMK